MKDTAKKYDCEKFFRYNHQVIKAVWEENSKKWHLSVKASGATFVDICDIFVNAGGVLDNWKWPDIDGIDEFKGKLMHSANWDQEYDFKGKKAAVIGIGSSGIQILPQVAKVADFTTLFARSETWITPERGISQPGASDPEVDEACNYAPKELKRFAEDPQYLLTHRKALQNSRIQGFKQFFLGTDEAKDAFVHSKKTMEERLGFSDKGRTIAEQLIPKFPVGCRRLVPGQGFLEALLQENVKMEWKNLDRINASGIITKDGRLIPCDVICCATGFDTSFKPVFPIIGRDGVNLADKWEKETPEAYFGITVSGFPNYFSKYAQESSSLWKFS
jgi:cation diffusion facilitator CzcD-associated flavoprotein CzcO